MKLKTTSLAGILLLLAAAACFGAETKTTETPEAVAVEPVFEFKPVLDGEEVVHDYMIQNKGSAELKIERVQTG